MISHTKFSVKQQNKKIDKSFVDSKIHTKGDGIMNPVNERIKTVRQALGLSQAKMADMVGLTKGGISQMEQDQRPISARHVKMLGLMFGVNADWVWTGDGEMFLDRESKLKVALETEWALAADEAKLIVNFIAAPPDQRRQLLATIDALTQWRQGFCRKPLQGGAGRAIHRTTGERRSRRSATA